MASYTGFEKLKGELAQRPGVKSPGGLASYIGAKKHGRKRMQQHAARGESLRPKS